MSENVHDGHRARMRDRAMHNGMKSFADHELLEMLLFQAIPRANTNTIAHALIERFGSLKGVLDADAMALKGVKGIGDAAICVLKLNAEIMRRYLTSEVPKENVFDTTGKIAEYLFPEFLNTDREHFYMMRFNNKLNLIGCDLISVGMVNCAEVQMRRIT